MTRPKHGENLCLAAAHRRGQDKVLLKKLQYRRLQPNQIDDGRFHSTKFLFERLQDNLFSIIKRFQLDLTQAVFVKASSYSKGCL